MKLSFNTETLFGSIPIYEAMKKLHSHGMNIIEFWSWHDKDLKQIRRLQQELGIEVAGVVVTPESLIDPSRREAALDAVKGTAEAARELGCRRMVHTVGTVMEGVSREEMHSYLIEGLQASIPILEEYGVMSAIEPLNTSIDKELSDQYLNTSDEAFSIVEQIGHPLIKVCYDMYHVQIMEGNVLTRLQNNIHHVGHIQGAGAPGRHELYLGELNYDYIFDAIKQMDYDGYVGIEYFPVHDPVYDLQQLHKKHHTG
ncbi:glyoxylate-induced protein [Paenibacillus sp. PK3_47]|uniref:TIM barrel protein n=1 Tax=Paenibacillus sp. PK3_47 TaxID=2072642 RepID=UPI00201D314E|nr:TIM barrel protein [Paenibacillus sp. PK3_47]UQZ32682.1 glyoxylate-induced protein [Paenibacillus sp. PK3_47]